MEALGLDVLFMGSNATRLLQGLWVAVQISAISVVLSIVLGMLFGIFMTWKNPVAKVISRLYLEIVRWGTGEMGDLVRGALTSIPKQQYESAAALGLNKAQIYRQVIIPQAIRRLIPSSINLITRMIKTTSLLLMIGVIEMMKVGQQIIEANRMTSPNAVFGIYGTIMLLYFIICWPISMLANHLEKKWN